MEAAMIRVSLVLVLMLLVVSTLPARLVSAQPAPIKVVTTILNIADMIKNVGGDTVDVTALVPAGAGPEELEPNPGDAVTVSQARVYFANGLGLEEFLDKLVENAANPQLEVITLSDGLPNLAVFGQGAE